MTKLRIAAAGALVAFLPALASAHEVYVLSSGEIAQAIATPAFNEPAVAWADFSQFIFWAFIAALTVCIIFGISIMRPLERTFDPLLARARRYAAPIARITVGVAFIAGAYYAATYGPELPMSVSFGAYEPLMRVVLALLGVLLVAGVYARAAAFAALCIFAYALYLNGIYMLTYVNYLGEIILLLILGAHHGASPHTGILKGDLSRRIHRLGQKFAPYSFAILRVCFGISLFYASFYAKILHNNLALQVAELPLAGHPFGLAHYFGLEPHFLVLGAAIIEIVIALFFALGIEIRFTSLFLLFWLSLSLWWFGEVVWPHLILIGIPIAFICYGYDKYSLEGYFFKRGGREPVL